MKTTSSHHSLKSLKDALKKGQSSLTLHSDQPSIAQVAVEISRLKSMPHQKVERLTPEVLSVLSEISKSSSPQQLKARSDEILRTLTKVPPPTEPTVHRAQPEDLVEEGAKAPSNRALGSPRLSAKNHSVPHFQKPSEDLEETTSVALQSLPFTQLRKHDYPTPPPNTTAAGFLNNALSQVLTASPPSRELLDSQKSYLVSNPSRYGFPERIVRLVHKFITENHWWLRFIGIGLGVIIAVLFIAPFVAL